MRRPSKYVRHNGRLRASRDIDQVNVSSRLVADITAEWYAQIIPKYVSGRVLDLGCGKAPLLGVYEGYANQIVLADWKNSIHANECLDVMCDLSKSLPFRRGSFDVVILSDVLEHIAYPRELIFEVARSLGNGGVLLMNVPFLYRLHEQPHDYYRYTEFALVDFMETAGFEIIELRASGGAPEVLSDFIAKLLAAAKPTLIFHPLASFVQWFCHRFRNTKFGSRVSRKTVSIFPLGYFLIARKR